MTSHNNHDRSTRSRTLVRAKSDASISILFCKTCDQTKEEQTINKTSTFMAASPSKVREDRTVSASLPHNKLRVCKKTSKWVNRKSSKTTSRKLVFRAVQHRLKEGSSKARSSSQRHRSNRTEKEAIESMVRNIFYINHSNIY